MIAPQDLRKAQLIMLDMLVEFDAICIKYNLKYWLDSGTLLGAVRHEGFIPWDDDIDISMPVEDYNKFIKIAKLELSKNIFFQTDETDSSFKFDYIKLRSNKASIVEFHEKDKEVAYHQGVFVDIFPMLTLPNAKFYENFYKDIFKLTRDTSSISLHTPNGVDHPEARKKLIESLETLHQGWNEEHNLKVIYSGKMPDVASWFDLDEVFPLSSIRFEGLAFYAPKNPQHYLRSLYSFNFMELPPKDKRTIHASKIEFN
ncbi:MAG: Lipopolysaccharide cholinephosphotransferase LicD1 (EC [uncultured Sulfurovum sp.]|uniref:Lipopolysaccharide cholinephosphotransferase LicD1 (EC) n=1 Tax=uncultured Sulfurovum sp. TaxID=269237 RepID=A0A6S6U3L4_9BACT|nr:MAG: Lipopolysaccharide cholinephosphotransferase LicD1 (EC [uncultured Sulfurovum sp.]